MTRFRAGLLVLVLMACRGQTKQSAANDGTPTRPPAATPVVATIPVDTVVADTGARTDSLGRLQFPIILGSSCEGEDCETSFKGLACDNAVLRASPSATAPVSARILRGDTLNVRRTDLHVLHPGIVVMKREHVVDSDADSETGESIPRTDTLRLAPGDTVFLLQYGALGSWEWWYRGRTSFGNEFWAGPPDGHLGGAIDLKDTSIAVARSQPKIQGWWLIQRRNGDVGWWATDSARTVRSIFKMNHWEDWCPGQAHP